MRFVTLLIAATVSLVHAYESGCGTMRVLQNLANNKKQPTIASTMYDSGKCSYEQYYDSVYTIETPHIQLFYVLKGPHATTKEFADSAAANMEAAWKFYVNKLNMRAPQGPSISYHYNKEVKEGLYPIEIVDIEQIRDAENYACSACYALTIPLHDPTQSQIFLDNDFYYGSARNSDKETIIIDGDTCSYSKGYIPLRNKTHDFSYTDEWAKGIRLTIFHEFYHAVQLRYLNKINLNNMFWFEASATGFEEITNPDIDDYFSYLPQFFSSMGSPISQITARDNLKIYGAATLFLYLYNKVSKDIDKSIWENFSKSPNKSFEKQLEASLKKYKLDADSLFHDYTVQLSLSGNRSNLVSKDAWITSDQKQWPSANFSNESDIKPNLESPAFKFYRTQKNYIEPDITDFIGQASVIIFKDGKASVHKIQNTQTIEKLVSTLSSSDSTMWIFSRFGASENIPITKKDSEPHVFPVPWRHGPLCFAPLPRDKKFFEIRNRRGDLVSQQKYDGTSFCLQEDKVKSMMAPGIYHFRVGNKGKTSSFIVIY